jgi:hypothetical protein
MDHERSSLGKPKLPQSDGRGEPRVEEFTVAGETSGLDRFAPLRCLQRAGSLGTFIEVIEDSYMSK